MLSEDPDFEKKAADIIGLYLNPPDHAAVFCVDEKTAIQALDRLDPVLPLSPGRSEAHGFEYYRHGTLSLYAALNTRSGEILGKTAQRHTSTEFVDFLPKWWPLSPSDARSTSSLIISRPIKPNSSMTFWPIIPKSAFILRPPILRGLTKSKSGSPKFKDRSSPEASFPPSTISEEKSFVTSGITTKLLLPSNGLTLRPPNESMRSSFICYAALGHANGIYPGLAKVETKAW